MSLTLEHLRRNPESFLKGHPMRISGSKDSGVGPHVYYWCDMGGTMTIATGKCPGHGYQFLAYTVPIDSPDDVTLRGIPSEKPASSILVTTLLTGCSFLWERSGEELKLGHVMPRKGGTGQQLQKELKKDHGKVYGRSNYGDLNQSSVIGIYSGGWRIYVQERSTDKIGKVKVIVK